MQTENVQFIELKKPDDFHLHLRDGMEMSSVVGHSASMFARALIMPNLNPPVITCEEALRYRLRIKQSLPEDSEFIPLMSLYLTDQTPLEEVNRLANEEFVFAFKYYPARSTTNASMGVTDIRLCYPHIEAMILHGIPLLVHGEIVDENVDVFDREAVFIDRVLEPLVDRYPEIKLVLEHISTKEAVDFVMQAPEGIAATITPQHLLFNRNALFSGGIRPHHYCLPVLKAERHRRAVVDAAISGLHRFFLGTDSAPHACYNKESACGCAGIYSAHAALPLYAEVFAAEGALDRLENFGSKNGADFYSLPRTESHVTLVKKPWVVPQHYPFGKNKVIPLHAGQICQWKLQT